MNYMNIPFVDMLKKNFEHQSSMMQNFNPNSFFDFSNKFLQNIQDAPWLKSWMPNFSDKEEKKFGFADSMKHVEEFSHIHQLSLENAQAMLRRQTEIMRKHAVDLYKLIQNTVTSSNPEKTISMQSDYMQNSFESLINDFKELSEMYAKSSLESFEAVSNKINEQMQKARSCMNSHEEKNCEKEQAKEKPSKKS
jgi:phasin family protein